MLTTIISVRFPAHMRQHDVHNGLLLHFICCYIWKCTAMQGSQHSQIRDNTGAHAGSRIMHPLHHEPAWSHVLQHATMLRTGMMHHGRKNKHATELHYLKALVTPSGLDKAQNCNNNMLRAGMQSWRPAGRSDLDGSKQSNRSGVVHHAFPKDKTVQQWCAVLLQHLKHGH